MDESPRNELTRVDQAYEMSLRPTRFADYVGQLKVRERLELMVSAARGRGEVLDQFHLRAVFHHHQQKHNNNNHLLQEQ
jgi:Holliday junction resolvasome RuvABC ATP-dependent DNA helicase subunit